jgi:acid phosphatase
MVSTLALTLALVANIATVAGQSWVKGKAFDRIAIIWLENTDYDLAAGDPNLAWLANKGISLTNYFAVTHPSQPNYAAAISGDYYGVNHDDMIAIPSNVSTLVDLLEDKGISWNEYQEDMPSVGFQGMSYTNPKTGANMYVRKHNPAVLYDLVAQKQDRLAKIKPLTSFNVDLGKNQLPQWMFITPNMTSDGRYSRLSARLLANSSQCRTRQHCHSSGCMDSEIS